MDEPLFSSGTQRLGRFGTLLTSLLLCLLVAPFYSDETAGFSAVSLLYTVVMLVGIYAVSRSRRLLLIGIAVAIPALATEWISYFHHTTFLVVGNMVLDGVFVTFVAGLVFHEILLERSVTIDTIAGGVAVYLLIGLGWVLAYASIEHLSPGSFLVQGQTLAEIHAMDQVRYPELIYFSFVTLTTLGFGDITPVSAFARTSAALEALVGQIYITVFVARLVGMHLAAFQIRAVASD